MCGQTVLIMIVICIVRLGSGGCYFPVEIQGEFMTQSMLDQEIAYTTVSIHYNSIPGWGTCHSRLGVRIILIDTTVNGDTCYRCVVLVARSPNVIQIQTRCT